MRRLVAFLPLVLAASSVLGQTPSTSLHIVGTPFDPSGSSVTYGYGAGVSFDVRSRTPPVGSPERVGFVQEVLAYVGDRAWDLDFIADGPRLDVGFYQHASPDLLNALAHPLLDIAHNDGSCQGSGSFAILDAGVDDAVDPPRLTSFAAVFDTPCEGRLL